MQALFAIVIFATATSLSAAPLAFPGFGIDIADGWEHSIEAVFGRAGDEVISIGKPGVPGSLKIVSYEAPAAVSEHQLRNMTNVDAAIPLAWQHWGDFSGYRYDYRERDVLYRQWWLVNERTLVFVTWQGNAELQSGDERDIDSMIRSLTIKPSPVG